MRRKKPHAEEHANHERWMVSYADFMTLLFALFVVMYAVSRADVRKVQQVAASIRFATHFEGTGGAGALPLFDGPASAGGGPGFTGASAPARSHPAELVRQQLERRLRPLLQAQGPARAVTVTAEGRRLAIRLAATEFFDPGRAALRPQALALLDAVAGEVVPLGRLVRVEGHCDELPYAGERYRNDWDLSAARAATVVTYLEAAHGAPRGLLAATGWGSARPVVEGGGAEAQALNRRVELVVELAEEDEALEPRVAAPAAAAPLAR